MRYLDVKEESNFHISILDYSQEVAVKLASYDNNLIIKGLPSSGKKETVINIISNNLYKEKSVLVISKNSDWLKEIYERLNYINGKIMLLSDSPMNLDDFYKGILEILENSPKTTGKTTLSKIEILSRDIDKKIEMLNRINELFNTVRYSGLNLLDMYKISKSKLNTSDDIYKYYKIYRIKKPFLNYKYNELNNSVKKLLNENNIDKYVKYKRFKTNKLFSILINNVTEENIRVALLKINSLLNNPLSLELPIRDSKYAQEFIEAFSINNKMELDDIKKLTQIVNLNNNASILNNENIIKKWSPIYWIKRKSIIELDNIKRSKFDNIEKNIYLEFIDNIENLNVYIQSFDFIKNILTEDEYSNFIKNLLSYEDIIEYLKNLRNTLNIYESFKGITTDIEKFDDIETELLDYCYNNIEIKEEMKLLISYIPTLYLLYSIEEIETREKDTLHYYKNFEIILKDIQLSINTKNSFVPSGIKNIWNNKILDMLEGKGIESSSIMHYLNNNNESKLEIREFLTLFRSIVFNLYPSFILDYNNVNTILPNIKGLFDIIIFHDGNNIYEEEVQSNIYRESKYIIIDECLDNTSSSLLDIYSKEYSTINLKYNYGESGISYEDDNKFNSYLQKELYDIFIGLGYKVRLNVKILGYNSNLVIYNKNEVPLLALECDDIIYNAYYDAREVEIYRRNYLEENGINIIRVWSRDWWLNKRSEIKRIEDILKHLISEI